MSRLFLAILILGMLATPALAFLAPLPVSYSRSVLTANPGSRVSRAPPLQAGSLTDLSLLIAAAADEYEYGAVAAPGWVLPLGAFLTLGLAVAIPLALRPGTEAFEEEKGRLEEMRRNRGEEEE
ncbi:Hypothetical protein NocV09_02400320 [Nannochloropsis oceanica]